jgi:hypothetical protein
VGERIAPEDNLRLEDTASYLVRNSLSLEKLVYQDGQQRGPSGVALAGLAMPARVTHGDAFKLVRSRDSSQHCTGHAAGARGGLPARRCS